MANLEIGCSLTFPNIAPRSGIDLTAKVGLCWCRVALLSGYAGVGLRWCRVTLVSGYASLTRPTPDLRPTYSRFTPDPRPLQAQVQLQQKDIPIIGPHRDVGIPVLVGVTQANVHPAGNFVAHTGAKLVDLVLPANQVLVILIGVGVKHIGRHPRGKLLVPGHPQPGGLDQLLGGAALVGALAAVDNLGGAVSVLHGQRRLPW